MPTGRKIGTGSRRKSPNRARGTSKSRKSSRKKG